MGCYYVNVDFAKSLLKGRVEEGIGIVKGVYYNIGILDGLPQWQQSGTIVETAQREEEI